VDRVVVLTPAIFQSYGQFYSVEPDKIAIVPNAVDVYPLEQQSGETRPTGSIREELNLPPETKLVFSVGRLDPEKDCLTFLRVAQKIGQLSDCPYAFLSVGSGSEEDMLRDYVAANNIESVFFLGHRQDVRRLLCQADVFLLTSRSESFGIVVLEAMEAGCPVISTRCGGPETIITHGENGLLADVGDVEGLANYVVHLLNDDALCQKLVRQGRQTVLDRYSVETVSARMADVYQQALKS